MRIDPSRAPGSLRILYCYPRFRSEAYGDVDRLTQDYLTRLRTAGYQVEGFCLTLDPPGPCLTWAALDRRWRWGDRKLLGLYERLQQALVGKDVLLNVSGINLHPDFVAELPVFTVFQCFDDPENSHNLSHPVAAAYDLCLVGNIAEVGTYRTWGVNAVEWTPMGVDPSIHDPTLTEQDILEGTRDVDLLLLADRTSPWRTARLDRLAAAFPAGRFHGKGWPSGYLPPVEQVQMLRRAKVGPNLHNSTGPVNFRTYYLPANGVLQVCDNRSHLGQIFRLGEEVVGFDTIDECIDLCRYYLAHDQERREIAARGFRRAMADYTEVPVFARKLEAVLRHGVHSRSYGPGDPAARQRHLTRWSGGFSPLVEGSVDLCRLARRGARWISRRLNPGPPSP